MLLGMALYVTGGGAVLLGRVLYVTEDQEGALLSGRALYMILKMVLCYWERRYIMLLKRVMCC